MSNYFKLFKWFVAINILILLLFCGYALWNLYQLESAMQAREEVINLNRYFDRHDTNAMKKTTTNGDVHVADFDGNVIISDFHQWRQSILSSLENLQDDVSYNLKFLLHTITSIVKNIVENDIARAKASGLVSQNATNSSTIANNKVIMTNLTSFEIHILKEFINLKKLKNKDMRRSRFIRTVDNANIDSECNLQLSIDLKHDELICLSIKPAKKETPIKMNNDTNYLAKHKINGDIRECTFNITYKPLGCM
jgi:hypothetical protein